MVQKRVSCPRGRYPFQREGLPFQELRHSQRATVATSSSTGHKQNHGSSVDSGKRPSTTADASGRLLRGQLMACGVSSMLWAHVAVSLFPWSDWNVWTPTGSLVPSGTCPSRVRNSWRHLPPRSLSTSRTVVFFEIHDPLPSDISM